MPIRVNPRALEDAARKLYLGEWFPNAKLNWPTWDDLPAEHQRDTIASLADFLRFYDEARELDLLRRRAAAPGLFGSAAP